MVYEPEFERQLALAKTQSVNTQRTQSYANSTAADPQLAMNVARWARTHPHVDPKVIYAAAASGQDPTGPLGMELAARSINKDGGGFKLPGFGKIVGAPLRMALSAAKTVADPLSEFAKPALRGTFAAVETPFQFLGANLRNIATGLPGQLGEIGAGALAGAGAGAAIGGISGGGVFSWLTAPVGAAIGAVGGGIAGGLADPVEGDPNNPFTQTTGGQIIAAKMKGQTIDLGAGYMPEGEIRKKTIDQQRAAASINGHALTGGRLIADGVFQPGTTAYNVMSGAVDLALLAKYDPTIMMGQEVKGFRQANRMILGKTQVREGSVVTDMLRKAGVINGNAKVVAEDVAADFLKSDNMGTVITRLVEEDSPYAIRKASGNRIPVRVARELAEATDSATVTEILKRNILSRTIEEKKALDTGKSLASTYRTFKTESRLGKFVPEISERNRAIIPAGGLDLIDLDNAPEKLDRAVDLWNGYLQAAGLDEAERMVWVDRMMNSRHTVDAQKTVDDFVLGELTRRLDGAGWDSEARQRALKKYHQAREDLMGKVREEIGADAQIPFVTVAGVADNPDDVFAGAVRARTLAEAGAGPMPANYVPEGQLPMFGDETAATMKEAGAGPRTAAQVAEPPAGFKRIYRSENVVGKRAWSVNKPASGGVIYTDVPEGVVTRFAEEGGTLSKVPAKFARKGQKLEGPKPVTGGEMPISELQGRLVDVEQMPLTGLEGGTSQWGSSVLPVAKANLVTELLDNVVQLPEIREIRRMLTPMGLPEKAIGKVLRQTGEPTIEFGGMALNLSRKAMFNHPVWKGSVSLMDHYMSKAWRPLTLLRPAWTVRIIGEEQARMLAQGLDAPIAHPFSLIAQMIGMGPKLSQATDATGGLLNRSMQYQEAMANSATMGRNSALRSKMSKVYRQGEKGYGRSWAGKLLAMHKDPVAQRIAERGLDDTVEWLTSPEGQKTRELIADVLGQPILAQPTGAAAHVARVAKDLDFITQGDADILHAVAHGAFVDRTGLSGANKAFALSRTDGKGILDPETVAHLERRGFAPNIKTPNEITGSLEVSDVKLKSLDAATEYMFNILLTRPTTYLSRSPAFNQIYWRKLVDILPQMTRSAADDLLANMDQAQIPKKTQGMLKMAAKRASGDIELEDADLLAKGYSVDRIRTIFDDATRKHAYNEALRHVMPFSHAWQQATAQWAKILVDDPTVVRKFQKVFEGGKGAYGGGEGQGFFHKDERGNWVFNYPGSEIVSKVVSGVPAPMQAEAGGMSMITSSVLPGYGPMMSIAASRILPHKPEYDDLRSMFAPYGDPSEMGVFESTMPPWFRKAKMALESPDADRMQGETVADVMKFLVSTGKYNTNTPEAQEELLDAATSRAKHLTMLRAIVQGFGPAAPKIVPVAQDKNGDTVVAQTLAARLHELQKEDYNTATERFLDEFGDGAVLFLQSGTRAANPGVTNLDTDKGFDFIREHPELAKKFPNTYGLFAPQEDDPQNFNYAAYLRLIKTGEREVLTPKEQVALANDKVGAMIYYNAKDKLGPKMNKQQRAVLAELKTYLMDKYPGFGVARVGLQERAQAPQLINELARAVDDPVVAETPVGQATTVYLQARTRVMEIAEARGVKFNSANQTADLREILRGLGAYLGSKTPGFSVVFDRVFDTEMKQDLEQEAPVSG